MTDTTPTTPEHAAIDSGASFLAKSRKALAGGITGLVTGSVGTSIAAAISDGTITSGEAWGIVGVAVGGFVLGFAGVWAAPRNAA